MSLAANRVPGVRAALCVDSKTARGARLWNRANVLCLSLCGTSQALASESLEAWFATAYRPNPENDDCLAEVRQLEDLRRPLPTVTGHPTPCKSEPRTE